MENASIETETLYSKGTHKNSNIYVNIEINKQNWKIQNASYSFSLNICCTLGMLAKCSRFMTVFCCCQESANEEIWYSLEKSNSIGISPGIKKSHKMPTNKNICRLFDLDIYLNMHEKTNASIKYDRMLKNLAIVCSARFD